MHGGMLARPFLPSRSELFRNDLSTEIFYGNSTLDVSSCKDGMP